MTNTVMVNEDVTRARVTAGDIRVGDRVARSRGMRFLKVMELKRQVVTVRLLFEDGSMDWPRLDACWWREIAPVAFTAPGDGVRVGPAAS
jgi:hypothetical protein